ncbi:MAG: 6-phosphogluconolactonase [Candidatus Latescibacterota bacterium]|jgi:6-phosphogluconolactonase
MTTRHYTRRNFCKTAAKKVLGAGFLLAGLPHITCAAATKTVHAYIGTAGRRGRDGGIYALALDVTTGAVTNNGPAAQAPTTSYLAAHPTKALLYAVDGDRQSRICAYAIDRQNRTLQLINSQPTHGGSACHVSLDQTGQWAFVANYSSGNVAVFPLAADGRLGEPSSLVQHVGTRPRAHMIIASPDNRFTLAADLGLDKIVVYSFDAEKGQLTPHSTPWIQTAAGAGPRHLAFHPGGQHIFAINEHNSTLSAYTYDRGELSEVQTLSTLPNSYTGRNYCAAVRLSADGRFVYGSNRGHDSIAAFSFDADKNQLQPSGHIASGGTNPRDIRIDPSGSFLLAANMRSGHISSFHIEQETGQLKPSGYAIEMPQPMSIAFLGDK